MGSSRGALAIIKNLIIMQQQKRIGEDIIEEIYVLSILYNIIFHNYPE